MYILKEIAKEETEVKSVFDRILKRDFSGNSGLAIKNSILQFSTNVVSKVGSLLFMIIIARLLMPELFGLYSLALGTIILFSTFANFGEGKALIRFVSNSLGKNEPAKAKSYLKYLLKIKSIFLFGTVLVLLSMSHFLAENYYKKPIFLALLAGAIYIILTSILAIFDSILVSVNNFRVGLFKEIVFQILRLILLPLGILFLLKNAVSDEKMLFFIILVLTFVYFLSFIFLLFLARKDFKFLRSKETILLNEEKKEVNSFLIAMFATVFSGIFFGYVDLIMLGHFVMSEFIGYYQAAFSLISSLATLIPFSVVLFPIFSRLQGSRLERGFRKSQRLTILSGLGLFLLAFLAAPWAIQIVYGKDYLLATNMLRLLSILIISFPMSSLYADYFISQGRTKIVAIFLISSTVLNIILNYFFISWGLNYSQLAASFGACFATIFSRYCYLFALVIAKYKSKS